MNRIIVVDVDAASREVLARRLCAQGYVVDPVADPATGADLALSSPPSAVVADLWMPGISGVQLCRLLHSEPATADVPVILRGECDDPRSRFWAERAGAVAYVPRGRTGELVRALAAAILQRRAADSFFMQLSGGSTDVRDRIAQHLDAALFESVIASEVRALASCGSLERLFDLLSQLLPQVQRYRWMAMSLSAPSLFALHHHPRAAESAEQEARAALGIGPLVPVQRIEDEDTDDEVAGPAPLIRGVPFAGAEIGRIAVAPVEASRKTVQVVELVAGELGGAIRIATLVEESQRLATIDSLTGLMNRRAFTAALTAEIARSSRHRLPLSLLLLDVDHFKTVNDTRGHPCGDRVLAAIGAVLRADLRSSDLAGRWGGEEFVITLASTPAEGIVQLAERIRSRIADLEIADDEGRLVAVTASIGVALMVGEETLDDLVRRADVAMYRAKHAGRNQVCVLSAAAATRVQIAA